MQSEPSMLKQNQTNFNVLIKELERIAETGGTVFLADSLGSIELSEDEAAIICLIDKIIRKQIHQNSIEKEREANRIKSEILSRMSHEMRTPMNAIIGMAQIAEIRGIPEYLKEPFENLNAASNELMNLIDDVLTVSDLEYGVFKLDNTTFNFNTLFKDVLQMINYYIAEKRQHFTYTIDPKIPANLIGDENRFKQVINNLLSNAVRFTPEQGVISFTAHLLGESGETITLQIEIVDNGIGMSKENQEKLFDIFEQEDGSLVREHGGAGLGLAISKRIIELMGGGISIESEPGKGAKFTFTCKLLKSHAIEQKQNNNYKPETVKITELPWTSDVDLEKVNFNGKLILVVDDMATNRFVMKNILEPKGIKIIEAESGKKALDLFLAESESIDLIFMDIRMPGMDGYEATRLIRASGLPKAGRVPILALTAHTRKEDVEEANAAGMNLHLGKPTEPQTLINALMHYL